MEFCLIKSFVKISAGDIKKPKKSILSWQLLAEKMAWNVLFILGGGIAMAAGATV